MNEDLLDIVFTVNSLNVGNSDKGLTWISKLHLSINPVSPYMIEKHVAYTSQVAPQVGLRYPEHNVLCGTIVAGKPDGYVPDFNTVERIIDSPSEPQIKYCVSCLKQSSFFLGVFS